MFRILIADDEETIRNGLKGLVESYDLGIKVIATAQNGIEALEAVKEFRPEIILMDINMPLMDGLKSIEKIRELDQEARIIIISGYGEFEYAQQAMSMGVEAYLLKPIDYKNFAKILNKAMESYSKRIWEINKLKDSLPETESCKDTAIAALEYLRENFTSSEISLASVADQFHISQSYLTKIIKQKTGNTFSNYINELRIHLAKSLLDSDKNYAINEISDLCGYSSQHYFSRAFKNSTGVSPVKYRALQETL